jgi:hypothetical protein
LFKIIKTYKKLNEALARKPDTNMRIKHQKHLHQCAETSDKEKILKVAGEK